MKLCLFRRFIYIHEWFLILECDSGPLCLAGLEDSLAAAVKTAFIVNDIYPCLS
jgi:hypothetical protein